MHAAIHKEHRVEEVSERDLGFSGLVRSLAHDFNNIWGRVFGLTQEAREATRFQNIDGLMGKVTDASCTGLFYSRTVMDILAAPSSAGDTFDACEAIRTWSYRTSETLGNNIDIWCMVPPRQLYIHFEQRSLELILLAFVGYALNTDSACWAMMGVRNVLDEAADIRARKEHVEIMLFLNRRNPDEFYPPSLEARVQHVRQVVAPFGGTVSTSIVSGVGVNARIRFPMISVDAAG